MVVGDTSQAQPHVVEAFRATSLTHLTAVSGTNLSLMVVFLIAIMRAVGARGWLLRVITAAGIVVFVALCRGEPSVLRAAAMGVVGMAATGVSTEGRGLRHWGVAIGAICLLQPAMSHSWGFAMSACATAGILWWSPRWSKALRAWAPAWAANLVAVPLAAPLATQPLVTAISGHVSLVGIFANMCAVPFVGPVTVLGLVACLLSNVSQAAATAVGWVAGWCSQPIIMIATGLGSLPGANLTWGSARFSGAVALGSLAIVCALISLSLPTVLRRWWSCALAFILLGAAAVVPVPHPGWPGPWTVAFCDVGQGDASVLRIADGVGVLVDAGPDPPSLRRCLNNLHIRRLALLVFSHEHSDHVDGAQGLASRVPIDLVLVRAGLPQDERARLSALLGDRTVPIEETWSGQVITVADLRWLTLRSGWSSTVVVTSGEDAQANNASIIAVAETGGLRVLFTGDAEPPAQQVVRNAGIKVDVLKVPHHGSSSQDSPFLTATGAALAVISVGVDNGYGHPAEATLRRLRADGMAIYRTDQCGSIAVALSESGLSVRTWHKPP